MRNLTERVLKSEEKLRKKCEDLKVLKEQIFNERNNRNENKEYRLQDSKLINL